MKGGAFLEVNLFEEKIVDFPLKDRLVLQILMLFLQFLLGDRTNVDSPKNEIDHSNDELHQCQSLNNISFHLIHRNAHLIDCKEKQLQRNQYKTKPHGEVKHVGDAFLRHNELS